jgi:hypothetical protein
MRPPNAAPPGPASPPPKTPWRIDGPPRPPRAPRALGALRLALLTLALALLLGLWAGAPQFFQPSRRLGPPGAGTAVDAPGALGR